MKHKKLLSLLMTAVTGISAAAIPTILLESPCLTAFAETGQWHEDFLNADIIYGYYEGSNEVIITKVYGEFKTPGHDVTIPAYIKGMPVTTIASLAFNCSKIHSVKLPETVKVIEARAFEACTLTSISLPQSLETIGAYAFSRSWLESVTVPAGVKVIEEATFSGCDRMTSVTLEGAELIEVNAFNYCWNITDLTIPDNCKTKGKDMAFSECRSLETINGYPALTHATDENGVQYPLLDPHCYNFVNQHCLRCFNMKFIEDYCTELCNYVVETETDPWMNDALKARQLHDWLIRHCRYDYDYVSSRYDLKHFIYSSFFLSFATSSPSDQLDDKEGLTVCEGYSKAYTMLLTACGIESYVVNPDMGSNGHAFNAVKIRDGGTDNLGHSIDQYYEVDVTWDDSGKDPVSGDDLVSYEHFLKSDAEMNALHCGDYPMKQIEDLFDEHALLNVYKPQDDAFFDQMKASCSESLRDSNGDGIQDCDLNLDGKWTSEDWSAFTSYLRFSFGMNSTFEDINDRLGDVLDNLHALHMSYGEYTYLSAPQNTSAAAGETADFQIRLFGDELTYQWYVYDQSTGQWSNAPYDGATGATLHVPANAQTNGKQFMCYVWNQDGYYLYSNPVTLTVI